MKDRFEIFRASKGYTQSRLAEILETQPGNISHILSGRSKPGFELLQKMFQRFPDLNPDWLFFGTGEMLRSTTNPADNGSVISVADAAVNNPSDGQERTSASTQQPAPNVERQAGGESQIPTNDMVARISERGDVVRVIVLYADHSFESFTPKR